MLRKPKKEKLDLDIINQEVQSIKDCLAQQSNNITATIGELLKNLNILQERINKINEILDKCPNEEVRQLLGEIVVERKEVKSFRSYLNKKIDLFKLLTSSWTVIITITGIIITAISYIISRL